MSAPLIGITIHPSSAPDRADLDRLLDAIVQGVEQAGGLPVLVPLGLAEHTLQRLYARLEGVLLPGGGDVAPDRYAAEMHPNVAGVDLERDRTEFNLMRLLAQDQKPFFGICRGTQVINVALGGTLYRDLSEHRDAGRHDFYPDFPADARLHEIKVEEESLLAGVIGQSILAVNSMHHQACKDIAPGLRVTAVAQDGIVEALEVPGRPFALGVQWHPESLLAAPEMRALFEAFVAASARHRHSRI